MTSEELEALRLQDLAQGGQVTEPTAKPAKGRPLVAD
jgi:predicted DNA-binding protein (UPF0251 family)